MEISEKREGVRAAVPLIVGYVPLAITFGLIGNSSGLSFIEVMLMTMFIYSGAGQFMILSLMAAGTGFFEIIFTTVLLNSRMFLMATSFVNKIEESLGKAKLYTALTITDETFSVSMFRLKKPTKDYMLGLNTAAFISWIAGAVIGYFFGSILPDLVKEGLGITLYAMFASMLMPDLKNSWKLTFAVLFSGGINSLITYSKVLPEGWGVILGIVIASLFCAVFFRRKEEPNG